jgi:hypothetical protein
MKTTLIEQIKENRLSALSAIGSLSSVVALGVVLIGELASDRIPAPLLGWRIIFFFVSLIATTGLLLATFFWARAGYKENANDEPAAILSATWRSAVGLMLSGIALDGVFSAIYWTPWLSGLFGLLRAMGII